MYFPAFYCTKELVMRKNPDLSRCLADYRVNMREDLLALWKIWVPATLINFAFMPMHLRIPFTAGVSLLWTAILSAMRGGDIVHGEEMAGGAVTGATLTMLEEGLDNILFTSPVELDRNMRHVMISASGLDKPGWVALLSRAVADAGGSVTHSRMVRLGSEFIILMHVSVKPAEHVRLLKEIKTNPQLKGLTVDCNSISRRKTGTYKDAVMGVRVRCVGADKYVYVVRLLFI
jgi:predicted amino acid-binding ACT domain protein